MPQHTQVTIVTIRPGTTHIGDSAFRECVKLTTIIIPDTVTSIGKSAFAECRSLITLVVPHSVTVIADSAFINCTSLTSVTLPPNVVSIGRKAFKDCHAMTVCDIPASVTSIGGYAFYECRSLTTVRLPTLVTELLDACFGGCTSLQTVDLSSIVSIGRDAFSGCAQLSTIAIPPSVLKIGQNAFYNCKDLQAVTGGESVIDIGADAFAKCQILSTYSFSSLNGCALSLWVALGSVDAAPWSPSATLSLEQVSAKHLVVPHCPEKNWSLKHLEYSVHHHPAFPDSTLDSKKQNGTARKFLDQSPDVSAFDCAVILGREDIIQQLFGMGFTSTEMSSWDLGSLLQLASKPESLCQFELASLLKIPNSDHFVAPQHQPRAKRLKEVAAALQSMMFVEKESQGPEDTEVVFFISSYYDLFLKNIYMFFNNITIVWCKTLHIRPT
jgi:hypothetical protein